jgi:peptidoglycan/LPS O-acetylase OafA/YrhL
MKRLECLDGLRGALAVYVALGHMAPFAVLPDWLQAAVSHGGAAVDVFFVLSGLVITQSLDRLHGETVPFLLARAARIFPVFLPLFALAVLIQPASCGFEQMPWVGPDNTARTICADSWPNSWPAEVVAHLTMTHGLFPNGMLPTAWVSFLGSSWSLSTEWQFYLLSLIALGAGRMGTTQASVIRLGCELMLLAAAGMVWSWSVPEAWQFSRAFLANKAHFFALGVASVGVVRGLRGSLLIYGAALGTSLTICAFQGALGKILPPLVWTLCLAAQLRPDRIGLNLVARLLQCRAAQYLGAISYCLYMANEPIHKLLAAALSHVTEGNAAVFTVVWLPAALLLPILASHCLHRYVEMPALRWGHIAARAWSEAHGDLRRPVAHTRPDVRGICAGVRPAAIGAGDETSSHEPSRWPHSPTL